MILKNRERVGYNMSVNAVGCCKLQSCVSHTNTSAYTKHYCCYGFGFFISGRFRFGFEGKTPVSVRFGFGFPHPCLSASKALRDGLHHCSCREVS